MSLGLLDPDGTADADAGRPLGAPATFDLRFFQTVRVPLGAEVGTSGAGARGIPNGARVRVAVTPEGDRHEPFVAILPLGTKVASAPEQ